MSEQWNVLAPISDSRKLDSCNSYAIEQVGSKRTTDDIFTEVMIALLP